MLLVYAAHQQIVSRDHRRGPVQADLESPVPQPMEGFLCGGGARGALRFYMSFVPQSDHFHADASVRIEGHRPESPGHRVNPAKAQGWRGRDDRVSVGEYFAGMPVPVEDKADVVGAERIEELRRGRRMNYEDDFSVLGLRPQIRR